MFSRGNRELMLEISSLQRRVEATLQESSEALRPVVAQIDRHAENILQLTENFAEARHTALNVVESLRREHEILRNDLHQAFVETRHAALNAVDSLRREHEVLRNDLHQAFVETCHASDHDLIGGYRYSKRKHRLNLIFIPISRLSRQRKTFSRLRSTIRSLKHSTETENFSSDAEYFVRNDMRK